MILNIKKRKRKKIGRVLKCFSWLPRAQVYGYKRNRTKTSCTLIFPFNLNIKKSYFGSIELTNVSIVTLNLIEIAPTPGRDNEDHWLVRASSKTYNVPRLQKQRALYHASWNGRVIRRGSLCTIYSHWDCRKPTPNRGLKKKSHYTCACILTTYIVKMNITLGKKWSTRAIKTKRLACRRHISNSPRRRLCYSFKAYRRTGHDFPRNI